MAIVIGVDIGTTSTKVVAFDQHGQALASVDHPYPLIQSTPDMAEEEPEAIFEAVVQGLQEVVASVGPVAGISFSAAMHSVIVLDRADQPLTRVLTWADNRGVRVAERLKSTPQGAALFASTGVPIHPMSPLIKLMWLNEAAPAVMAQAVHIVGIKDYVLFRLFGRFVQDYSLANATGLLNLFTLDWEPTALALAGVSAAQLPQLVDTNYQLSGMLPTLAAKIGIDPQTPVIVGASDGVLSNLGVGANRPGTVALTIGTSGAVRTIVSKPVVDPDGRLFTYYLAPGRYVVGAPVNNGGVVWRWARDTFAATGGYGALENQARQIPAGADGLLFLPYLGGERAPLWDADARGSFIGLTRQHGQAAMIKAVMEGISFNLFGVLQLVERVVGKPTRIQATGGFARSALWKQVLCDIFDLPVVLPEAFESSALGAAVIGMQALGIIDSLDDVEQMVGGTETLAPNAKTAALYATLWPLWQDVNTRLASAYAPLAAFQRQHPDTHAEIASEG
ncbi:gluconokinase [Lacticaseibacillus sp. GG6-2]